MWLNFRNNWQIFFDYYGAVFEDGALYDCDFKQMLEMETNHGAPSHVKDFDLEALNNREILIKQHCFGCSVGAGSSYGGATV